MGGLLMTLSANQLACVGAEPTPWSTRLARLAKIEGQAEKAGEGLTRIRRHGNLRIRVEFAWRDDPANPNGDLSARLVPPRNDRPPATRLVSPRGIALKLYLIALFVSQSRSAGELPDNKLPLADPDAPVSWIDLVATPAERHRGRIYRGQREKKLRQVQDALRRLSDPGVQLVELPNFRGKPVGKYEGFLLMREGGAPYGGGDNQLYTVPAAESKTMLLPGDLFLNGWIQVLEDSELAFLLMLACLRSRVGSKPVFASSETRLLQFGLGRDAYEAHRILSELGIVKVQADPNRHGEKVHRYSRSNPPKLYRFELLNDGFGRHAIPTMQHVLQRRRHEIERSAWPTGRSPGESGPGPSA
jgi:hypothetical protein